MNSVFQITDCCRTCMRVESALTPLDTVDSDNIKLCDKLAACVSDIVSFLNKKHFYDCLLCRHGQKQVIHLYYVQIVQKNFG